MEIKETVEFSEELFLKNLEENVFPNFEDEGKDKNA